MIGTRERPRVTNPAGKKCDNGGSLCVFGKRRTITERDFHFRGRQRPGQLLRNRAVRAIGANEKFSRPLYGRLSLPPVWGGFEGGVSRARNLSPDHSPRRGEGRAGN